MLCFENREQQANQVIDYLRVKLRSLIADRKGLETLEYAMFAVGYLVVISGVVATLRTGLTTAYGNIGTWIVGQASKM
ncbi:MAG TPA: hypothetical protein VJY39_18655 [Acidisphaera sp.]|nr:hypothetical protein [Acidisphaera sp.]